MVPQSPEHMQLILIYITIYYSINLKSCVIFNLLSQGYRNSMSQPCYSHSFTVDSSLCCHLIILPLLKVKILFFSFFGIYSFCFIYLCNCFYVIFFVFYFTYFLYFILHLLYCFKLTLLYCFKHSMIS